MSYSGYPRVPTIPIHVVLKHKDTLYEFDQPFETLGVAQYMYHEGNYGCDCNRSIFIQEYRDPDFPDLSCGSEIELVALTEG